MNPSPKFWCARFQEWMTLEEIAYRKMLAQDQAVCIRETPAEVVSERAREMGLAE